MLKIIDFHAHIIPPKLVETLRRKGGAYGVEVSGAEAAPAIRLAGSSWTKPIPLPLCRIAERLETLDRQGIDMQVMANWIDFSGYTMPAELGIKFSELQNELVAEVAAANTERLLFAATLPMQAPTAAVKVMERAVTEYGTRSVQIATYFGGDRFLDDPALDPVWEAAQALGVLVYIHPYDETPPNGTRDYFLHNVVNYPLQTAIAIPRMIFARVLERFPKMKICFPHGGGYLPYQFGRIRRAAEVRPEPKVHGYAGDPLDQFKSFYFDTIVHNPKSLAYLADMVGADRLVMGSDYPFDMNDPDPVASVRAGIAPEAHAMVLGGTAASLIGLPAETLLTGRKHTTSDETSSYASGTARLNYKLEGDIGPWVTLAHSLASDLALLDGLAGKLVDAGYRVLRFDIRGHGGSDVPAGPYTMPALAADVRALLAGLGIERTHWVGVSLGAMIGMTLALEYPGIIDRMVVADTTAGYGVEGHRGWRDRIAAVEEGGTGAIQQGTLARWFTDGFRARFPDIVARIGAMIPATPAAGWVGCAQAILGYDIHDRIGDIVSPALVIVGSQDHATPPEMAEALASGIPGAELVVIPDAAHQSLIEQPELFDGHVINFLANTKA